MSPRDTHRQALFKSCLEVQVELISRNFAGNLGELFRRVVL